jgi:site-specific DNA recombinase
MNALFLKDLAQKTRRGLQGRVLQGLSGGGVCYGYDLVPGETGSRRINAGEAKVVQAIFRDFAAGMSPRAIARKLNQKGIAGPSGRSWREVITLPSGAITSPALQLGAAAPVPIARASAAVHLKG